MNPLQKSYYFITAEWMVVPQTSLLVPNAPQQEPHMVKGNAVIEMHPSIYSVLMQQKAPGYVVTFAMQINKEMYEQVKGIVSEMQAQANGNGHVESEVLSG